MLDWITEIFNKFMTAVQTLLSELILLPGRLDSIQFDENFALTKFLGLIHYILGTPLYMLFCTVLLIGAGFILYHIAKTLIAIIEFFIPKLKGRFILP